MQGHACICAHQLMNNSYCSQVVHGVNACNDVLSMNLHHRTHVQRVVVVYHMHFACSETWPEYGRPSKSLISILPTYESSSITYSPILLFSSILALVWLRFVSTRQVPLNYHNGTSTRPGQFDSRLFLRTCYVPFAEVKIIHLMTFR